MKLKSYFFLLFLSVLGYLAFVDNLSIDVGDEPGCITQKEWLESNHPDINEFRQENKEEHEDLIDHDDFNLFLKEMSGKPFFRHDISYHDTTGDGEKEGVHSIVQAGNETCTVTNYVEKNNEVIWKDEFVITRELACSSIGNSAFVENYGAYALFYLGQVAGHFTEKLEKNALFDERKKSLLRNRSAYSSLRQLYNSPLSASMEHYSGMYLFRSFDGLQQIYMWEKETAQFVCIHKNNPILS